jgi:nicotinate-nucleotide pyrophosphorylase (carboxylating)
MNALSPEAIRNVVGTALAEDIGAGDITTESAIPADQQAEAVIVAKEGCIVAGLLLVEEVFRQVDRSTVVKLLVDEGEAVSQGARVCILNGPARAILTGERTALNFLQRLSGIATLTRQFVEAVATVGDRRGSKPKILDTRKNTPTLRALEKYAVALGGGENHRMGLFDAVMIKDNHRAILSRLGPKALGDAVRAARKNHPRAVVIIEADTLEQVEEALAVGADHILLDNMTPDELREGVRLVAGRAKTEASGGVRLDTVAAIAATGVDYISIGALTHSARAVDFSLDLAEGLA